MKKKKILFQSDYSLAKTGFGRNAKAILSYLYKTGKYEIVNYCCGIPYSAPFLEKTPWKSVGTLPDSEEERKRLDRDPNMARVAAYGAYYLDRVIKEEKPDVYIAVQDIWGVDFAIKKPWFKEIPSVIWTTLDSLPILPTAIEAAEKVDNYWIWSSFATNALHKLGHKKVKTVHGALDTSVFYKLSNKRRKSLRSKFKISEDDFIVGFVFRNQLRKSVPNLLEGFKKFKDENPKAKSAKLLLHTYFPEGWEITKLAREYEVNPRDILATYVCKACHEYNVRSYAGENLNCPFCKASKSVQTASATVGVTEEELNEIYNLMDVYCHPFTSGGQEFPIQEAKLAELITLVTDYSCGEEMCEKEAKSLSLDWAEYREHGTQFIKASTYPNSIAERLKEVFDMTTKERAKIGREARKWAKKNFSVETVGGQIENFIDALPEVKYDFSKTGEEEKRNPFCEVPDIESDEEWILFLYHNILVMRDVDKENEGFKYWLEELKRGASSRKSIENYFRKVAQKENNENEFNAIVNKDFEKLLGEDDKGKRLLYVIPESIGDVYLSTSLFKSIKEQYPEYNLYVATKPEFRSVLDGNPYIYRAIPYVPQMEDILFLEGKENHKGFFEIAFLPFTSTQRQMTYPHNGKDKIAFKDYKYA